jgi:hypothetical protein
MFFRKKLPEIILIQDFINPKDISIILDFVKTSQFRRAHQHHLGRNNYELFTENDSISNIIYSNSKNRFKIFEKPNILEFYRYEKGDFLTPHSDQPTRFNSNLTSNYTAIIYLNDDFIGGQTFFTDKNELIFPKAGSLLLFAHYLKHEGTIVELGTKYIFRSNWLVK